MKILIVDDEELARIRLKEILAAVEDIEIIGEAKNGLEALEKISQTRVDAVFLDVQMPGLNGFEVVENMTAKPLIVFATAFDEYAVKAFETNAIDYILKPFEPDRILQTIEKLRERFRERKTSFEQQNLSAKLSKIQSNYKITKLVVRKATRFLLLPLREIIYFRIEDTILFVHTASERLMCDKTISEMENRLNNSRFFRINRSEIVNLESITEIIPWFSGTLKLKLSNNQEVQVSRERSKRLRELLF